MNPNIPVISICCVTYNHVNFIKDCLNGFLIQRTTFPYEILVHDDASTDGTAEIIKEFETKSLGLFRCIYQTENQFFKQNTLINLLFPMARGKYIALCEGDDYWTDPNKLQRQTDFLELNPSYSAVAHQSIVKYESDENSPHYFKNPESDIIETNDLLIGRLFHTASVVFRKSCIEGMRFPQKIAAYDRALFLLCAMNGPIKFFSEPYCVYRKNKNSLSNTIVYSQIKRDTRIGKWLVRLKPGFPFHKYQMHVHLNIINYSKVIPLYAILWHYFWFLYHAAFDIKKNIAEIKNYKIRKVIRNNVYGVYRRIFHPGQD